MNFSHVDVRFSLRWFCLLTETDSNAQLKIVGQYLLLLKRIRSDDRRLWERWNLNRRSRNKRLSFWHDGSGIARSLFTEAINHRPLSKFVFLGHDLCKRIQELCPMQPMNLFFDQLSFTHYSITWKATDSWIMRNGFFPMYHRRAPRARGYRQTQLNEFEKHPFKLIKENESHSKRYSFHIWLPVCYSPFRIDTHSKNSYWDD